jgi:hypothetical protein
MLKLTEIQWSAGRSYCVLWLMSGGVFSLEIMERCNSSGGIELGKLKLSLNHEPLLNEI